MIPEEKEMRDEKVSWLVGGFFLSLFSVDIR